MDKTLGSQFLVDLHNALSTIKRKDVYGMEVDSLILNYAPEGVLNVFTLVKSNYFILKLTVLLRIVEETQSEAVFNNALSAYRWLVEECHKRQRK